MFRSWGLGRVLKLRSILTSPTFQTPAFWTKEIVASAFSSGPPSGAWKEYGANMPTTIIDAFLPSFERLTNCTSYELGTVSFAMLAIRPARFDGGAHEVNCSQSSLDTCVFTAWKLFVFRAARYESYIFWKAASVCVNAAMVNTNPANMSRISEFNSLH